jgi:transcriptional regulator with XRE-family HTH domain
MFMGLGKNIQKLRTEAGLTQKELADKLFVTAQAVSRWEQEIVEPNIQTIKSIANIFGVDVNRIINEENETVSEETKTEEETKQEVVEPSNNEQKSVDVNVNIRQVLTMCDVCHKPIYVGEEVHTDENVYGAKTHECHDCYTKRTRRILNEKIRKGVFRRNLGIILGSISIAILIAISIIVGVTLKDMAGTIIPVGIAGSLLFGMFLFTMIVDNSFLPEFWFDLSEFGFVKFPGLIFHLDLDGIIWFITVKLLFFILGIILAVAACALATAFCMALTIFVFPFALNKSIKHPELSAN